MRGLNSEHRLGKHPEAEALDEMFRTPWTLGDTDIEMHAARDFPSRDEILQVRLGHAQAGGNIVSGADGKDRYRGRASDQPSRDFTNCAIPPNNGDNLSWFF